MMRKDSAHSEVPTCHPLSRCCVDTDVPQRARLTLPGTRAILSIRKSMRERCRKSVSCSGLNLAKFHPVAVHFACEADFARGDLPFRGERSAASQRTRTQGAPTAFATAGGARPAD